jgi:hypothetical protein
MKSKTSEEVAPHTQPRRAVGQGRPKLRRSTARMLLACADKWEGDDFERCLKEVYAARARARF